MVVPDVLGAMGLVIKQLKRELRRVWFLGETHIAKVIKAMQREAICGSVRLLRRHLSQSELPDEHADNGGGVGRQPSKPAARKERGEGGVFQMK